MGIFGKDNFFYHQQIRNYNAVFGSLFDDLFVKQVFPSGDEQFKKVMIKQGVGNLYENTQQSVEGRDKRNVSMILPAMAYELVSFARADERKTNPNLDIMSRRIVGSTSPSTAVQLNKEPFNFTFELTIRTKTEDEMAQIVEQIVGSFNPSITVKVLDNRDIEEEQDVVVFLNDDFQKDNNYADFDSLQYVETTCTFTLKGYFYRRTQTDRVVTKVTVSVVFNNQATDDWSYDLSTEGIPVIEPLQPDVSKTIKRKQQNKPET